MITARRTYFVGYRASILGWSRFHAHHAAFRRGWHGMSELHEEDGLSRLLVKPVLIWLTDNKLASARFAEDLLVHV